MAAEEAVLKVIGAVAALVLTIPVSVAVSDAYRPAAPVAPPAEPAPFTLALSGDGRRVDLTGRIDFGITADLTALLEDAPDIALLRLRSQGGRVAEARGLVMVVRRFGLATRARGDCVSVCTLVFVAGHSRSLEAGARLGFHGYDLRAPVFGLIDPQKELERDSAVFRSAGVDADFMARAMAVPHRSMWYPERGDLIAAGVIDRR
ncbi:hypothetical protein [Pararhodobacter sp. SW119]|uniref:COG3904 family protein n=1 Tax=Pararhodobacter sp. SW119 TaxID=2780075 RepID=UPI001AE05E09|nr:hypothetical protein [Pararhodobacter sp. SW119]